MRTYLPIYNQFENIQNLYVGLFFLEITFIFLIRILFFKRYLLNVTRPNVYIFEYETQLKKQFTLYSIITLAIRYFSYLAFGIAIIYFINTVFFEQAFSNTILKDITLVLLSYFFVKYIIDYIYIFFFKKIKNISKISSISRTYQNFAGFYLYLTSFFIFFFPFKNKTSFYLIVTLSVIFISISLLNYYYSLKKHIDLKPYQILLYLCLSEILPLIMMIYWISFQIL